MAKKDTKDKILKESLTLFSKNGYDGVSMRDIAKEVGFRESALYKHYNSKQDILDSIFNLMKLQFEEDLKAIHFTESNDYSELAKKYQSEGIEEMFLYWFKDEQAIKFRRLLILEQFRHPNANYLLREYLIDNVLQNQIALFSHMIEIGYFRKADPEVMALQFYSPLFFMLCKYDGQKEKEAEALSLITRFVTEFDSIYRMLKE